MFESTGVWGPAGIALLSRARPITQIRTDDAQNAETLLSAVVYIYIYPTVASIAINLGGAVLNAAAFIGGNYLGMAFGGSENAAPEEKVRHDKALAAYQANAPNF